MKHKLIILILCNVLLSGCAAGKRVSSTFEHYDTCLETQVSFVKAATCGKKARESYCKGDYSYFRSTCRKLGDSFVQYADTLADSVKAKELSNTQAKKRWIEFKIEQLNAQALQAAQETKKSSYIPAKAPNYKCTSTGSFLNCNPW